MKWFYNLKRVYRILIVCLCFVSMPIVGAMIGENADNATPLQSLLAVASLTLFTVSLVFAIIARKKEKAAAKATSTVENPQTENKNAPAQQRAEAKPLTYTFYPDVRFDATESDDGECVNFPIHTKARGVTFEGRQAYLQESKEGDTLSIKHAPTAQYPDTISITNERTGKILGNVGADLAASLLGEFGEGCEFVGEITEITGGDGQNLGCNFVIDGVA